MTAILLSILLAQTVVLDRIAATIDREVITVSAVDQVIAIRIIPRNADESDTDHRRRVLGSLISQALRYRDVQRFGATDVSPDAVAARLLQVQQSFATPAEFEAALTTAELTLEDVQSLIKRQLQVETYIQERFSPLIYVSPEDLEQYYRTRWLPQRAERGLPPQPLTSEVAEEVRQLIKADLLQQEIAVWTEELRERASVDVFVYR